MLVVKVGGSEGVAMDAVCQDISFLGRQGQPVILVHGGSHEVDLVSHKLGKPPQFVTTPSGFTSRYTDLETLEIFAMVVAGKVNKLWVRKLQAHGVNAVGLCGLDGQLLRGRRKRTVIALENGRKKVLHDDYGGTVDHVDAEFLRFLLERGYTPVVAPLVLAETKEMLNVDADRVAAAVAVAMKAEMLVILSVVPGLLKNPENASTLIPHISKGQARDHLELYAKGRMKKKLLSAIEALEQGVTRVVLADGRVERPLLRAMAGEGTVIR